jgi:hypothetical protein
MTTGKITAIFPGNCFEFPEKINQVKFKTAS